MPKSRFSVAGVLVAMAAAASMCTLFFTLVPQFIAWASEPNVPPLMPFAFVGIVAFVVYLVAAAVTQHRRGTVRRREGANSTSELG